MTHVPERPEESHMAKASTDAAGKPAAGQCLCGKVAFEIDVPARWAWHDQDREPAARRIGAAYATYVGSWRKRFQVTDGGADHVAHFRIRRAAACAAFAVAAARRSPMSGRARRTWSTFRARCSRAAPAASRSITSRIEELQEWAYTGEPLVPLKGFPGVVWQRSKKKKRADRERMA